MNILPHIFDATHEHEVFERKYCGSMQWHTIKYSKQCEHDNLLKSNIICFAMSWPQLQTMFDLRLFIHILCKDQSKFSPFASGYNKVKSKTSLGPN